MIWSVFQRTKYIPDIIQILYFQIFLTKSDKNLAISVIGKLWYILRKNKKIGALFPKKRMMGLEIADLPIYLEKDPHVITSREIDLSRNWEFHR